MKADRRSYRIEKLPQCMLFSRLLSNAAHLKKAMLLAAHAIPPPAGSAKLKEQVEQNGFGVPARSAIYRSQLVTHMGWIMYMRDRAPPAMPGDC
eukprot:3309958-Alexandrium_andersonii.AAC.1